MSLFARVCDESSLDPSAGYAISSKTAQPQSAFFSYVKEALIYGAPVVSPLEDPPYSEPAEAEDWSYDDEEVEPSLMDGGTPYESLEDDEAAEDEEIIEDENEGVEDEGVAVYPVAEMPKPRVQQPNLVQHLASEQKDDPKVERIVDQLFDRMKVVWGDKTEAIQPQVPTPAPPAPLRQQTRRRERETTSLATTQRNALVESRNEITKTIRDELPRAMKGEILALLRKEILTAVRNEIVRVVREEFETTRRLLEKNTNRLYEIESRMAKIEGAIGQEVKINFPKGMVKIDAPTTVTVPEREVKIAAPINVQPPSVTFDEGAISVQFNKQGGKREVRFERDPHDQNIKSAEIIDAPER